MNRLFRQVLVSYVPKIGALVAMLLMTKLLTNELSTDDYGVYGMIAGFGNYMIFLAGFGAHRYLAREVPGRSVQRQHRAFFRVLRVEAVLFVLMALAASLAMPLLADVLRIGEYWRLAAVFIWASASYLLYNEIVRFFGFQRRIELKSALAVIDRPLFLGAVWGVYIWAGYLSVASVLGVLAGVYVVLLVASLPFMRWGHIRRAGGRSHPPVALLAMGLMPLFLIDLFTKTKDLLPRYLLSAFDGPDTTGLYAFSDNCARIFFLLVNSLVFVFYPYIAASYRAWKRGDEQGDKPFIRGLGASMGLSIYLYIAAGVVGYVFRAQIVVLLSSTKYLGATEIMPILLIGYLLLIPICILQPIIVLTTSVRKLWPPYLAMLLINVAMTCVLTGLFLTRGAAWGVVMANCLWLVLVAILAWEQVKKLVTVYGLLRLAVYASVVAGTVIAIASVVASVWVAIATAITGATAIFVLFEYRDIRYLISHKQQ